MVYRSLWLFQQQQQQQQQQQNLLLYGSDAFKLISRKFTWTTYYTISAPEEEARIKTTVYYNVLKR